MLPLLFLLRGKTMDQKKKYKKPLPLSLWGILFILPFFIAFVWFQLVPLIRTFSYSFQTYYYSAGKGGFVKTGFCGFDNYAKLFTTGNNGEPRTYYLFDKVIGTWWMSDISYYLLNTLIIWIMGFVPQIIVSLALAIWFTDARLKLKFTGFWKTVMYMPNLVMAAAFGYLFLMLFSDGGPMFTIFKSMGLFHDNFSFNSSEFWVRFIIALINFLMWFGNTTLLLMSGVMGIDDSVFESAVIDGSSAHHTFWTITFPLLRPIFIYVFITSLIGGVQLFDVAWMFTRGVGGPNLTSLTIMMYLYQEINIAKDYGLSGALSVIMFLVTAILSMSVYFVNNSHKNPEKEAERERKKRFRIYKDCDATKAEMARLSRMDGGVAL
jgi:cellobiose transport system permease protein